MKPISIFVSILLGIACLGTIAWVCAPTPPQKPVTTIATAEELPMPKGGPFGKAEINETTFKFGTRLVGSDDEHVFTIKNVGLGNLEFKLGKPTCQCTGVTVSKSDGGAVEDGQGSIAPGDSINVLLKWTMKAQSEAFRHGVDVFTTDPDLRTINIHVEGKVSVPFFFRPDGVWDLGELSTSAPTTSEGVIASYVYDAFSVEEEPRENPHVKVTFSPLEQLDLDKYSVKSGYKVKVEVGPEVPVGPFREVIKVKASKDDQQQISEIMVKATRAGPIEIRGVQPGAVFNSMTNRLIFTDFPAAEGKKATMTLFVKRFDGDLELQGIESADTLIKGNLTPGKMLGKSKSYQLEIEIPPGGPIGAHRVNDAEVIVLKFNHPEVPEFKMQIDYNAVR